MTDLAKISEINKVIETYFSVNSDETIVPAKKLMPEFIRAGIFTKDHKNGLPIRSILRELDKTNQLELIPFVYAERNNIDVYWYFMPANAETPSVPYKQEPKQIKEEPAYTANDESYVIGLCDMVLNKKAYRQKRFDFLLGDLHKDGKTRTKLPVGAFYDDLNLVVEYITEPVYAPDLSERELKRNAARDKQRKLYNKRRAEDLPAHGVNLVVVNHFKFTCDKSNKIVRNESKDLRVVKKLLREYVDLGSSE